MLDSICFSSWVERGDIISDSVITGSQFFEEQYGYNEAKDGFQCKKENKYTYIAANLESTWFEVDLKKIVTLKCVKVATRFPDYYFTNVEFRFGNESQDGDYFKNPLIAFSGSEPKHVFEFCLDYSVVGKYLGLRQNFHTYLIVGEIQIILK